MTTEHPPPFGTWLLTLADRPDQIGTLATKAAADPDWPKYGDFREVHRHVHPHRIGSGTGAVDGAYDLYKAAFPDA